jgi:hypothetical protein
MDKTLLSILLDSKKLPTDLVMQFVNDSQKRLDSKLTDRIMNDLSLVFKTLELKLFLSLLHLMLPCLVKSKVLQHYWPVLKANLCLQVACDISKTCLVDPNPITISAINELLEIYRQNTSNVQIVNDTTIESIIFAFGMAEPLEFYVLLNNLAVNPEARLSSFLLLKSFLILDVHPANKGSSHLLSY